MRKLAILFFLILRLSSLSFAAGEKYSCPPFAYVISPTDITPEALIPEPFRSLLGKAGALPEELPGYCLSITAPEPYADSPTGMVNATYCLGSMTRENFLLLLDHPHHVDHRQLAAKILPMIRLLRKINSWHAYLAHLRSIGIDLDVGDCSETYEKLLNSIAEIAGPLRASYLQANIGINQLSNQQLLKLIGFKHKARLLTVRRFGYVRGRIALPAANSGPDAFRKILHKGELSTLLIDSAHAYVPGFVPPPFYDEFESLIGFGKEMNSKELLFMWRKFSSSFHSLALNLLKADLIRRKKLNRKPRAAVTPNLLELLQEENENIDLSRAFFFVIEEYETEEMLGTFALIDGSQFANEAPYELPVIRRLKALSGGGFDVSQEFPSEHLFEMHSLAIDPYANPKVDLESAALMIAAHIEEAGFEDAIFIVQTDSFGARIYEKFGLVANKAASDIIGENEFVLSVKGSDFIKNARALVEPKGVISAPFPNRITKRLAGPDNDKKCEERMRAQ